MWCSGAGKASDVPRSMSVGTGAASLSRKLLGLELYASTDGEGNYRRAGPNRGQLHVSSRDKNPRRTIVEAVIEKKGENWNDSTRKVVRTDAQRILESLIAEYGIEASVRAMEHQGFEGEAYRYLLGPLHDEAIARRPTRE